MRFRVTSITDESVGRAIAEVTVKLEDWLNAIVANGEFGTTPDLFVFMVISVDDEESENQRWEKAHNKLGSTRHFVTGSPVKYLSLAIPIKPSLAAKLSFEDLLAIVCQSIMEKLSVRPKRLPAGFEFSRCAQCISAALSAFISAPGSNPSFNGTPDGAR